MYKITDRQLHENIKIIKLLAENLIYISLLIEL